MQEVLTTDTPNKRSAPRFIFLLAVATLLTALFVFLGSPLLRLLRNVYGSLWYWASAAVLFTGLWFADMQLFVFFLAGLWISVGLYSEVEERGRASFWSALFCVLVGSAVTLILPIFWMKAKAHDERNARAIHQR